jgi:hypothetical protein
MTNLKQYQYLFPSRQQVKIEAGLKALTAYLKANPKGVVLFATSRVDEDYEIWSKLCPDLILNKIEYGIEGRLKDV